MTSIRANSVPTATRRVRMPALEPNEETASNVQLIFELAQDGYKSSEIVKALKGLSAQFTLVGSSARNMVARNGDGPFDLGYNFEIIKAPEEYWNDLQYWKNTIPHLLFILKLLMMSIINILSKNRLLPGRK